MTEAKPHNTASIWPNLFCRACGWPIIHACCNDEMGEEPWGGDYWAYCSNKGCENHAGEDALYPPDFTFRADAPHEAGN
jgi:hypothetical protein